MPKCGECKELAPDPKGVAGYRCQAKRCGATKMTPDTDAGKCKLFQKKK